MDSDNKYFREYQQMVVKLHTLIAAGDGDSDFAVEVRQEIAEPEAHLSQEEVVRLNALPGDLSMFHGREIPDPEVIRRVPEDSVP